MAKVELKQPIVAAIAEDVKDAQSVVIVDYRGLTVAEDTELRKQLREAGIIYKVCKNTMMKRAFEGTDFAGLAPQRMSDVIKAELLINGGVIAVKDGKLALEFLPSYK